MVQGCRVAIVGGGPAGVMTASLIKDDVDVTIFDPKPLLATLLPTGGGKCNLAHCEYDFRELVKNYPRGEKFLYSLFSKFCTAETIEYFSNIGVETVALENGKIFPVEMSSKFVREKMLAQIRGCAVEKEKVLMIELKDGSFIVKTEKSKSLFDKVIITTGGHCDFGLLESLGVEIISPKPALCGLCTLENYSDISGLVLKNVSNKETGLVDDLLFTHFGVSGPLIFKISSLRAREEFPYSLTFDVVGSQIPDNMFLQNLFDSNPHKEIKNVLAEFLPRNFVTLFLNKISMSSAVECCKINGNNRDKIFDLLKNYTITVTKPRPDGETVMCGGVDLKQINPKTLEHKSIPNLYFAGEVLDIDGFCGGFNLQNCWSGAFIVSESILNP